MAERITIGYKRLFEVRLLHHYWIDEGAKCFDLLPKDDAERLSLPLTDQNQPTQEKRLFGYDCRLFLSVEPVTITEKVLKEIGGFFKSTALGFLVAVPDQAVIPSGTEFQFMIKIIKSDFFNYTSSTLRRQEIVEYYYQPADKLYRYKTNVFVFSNLTGTKRGSGTNPSLFLSAKIPAPTGSDPVESIIDSNGVLVQLTGDDPGASTMQLAAVVANMPVFVNQNDVPTIPLLPGQSGSPIQGLELSEELHDDMFALIHLSAVTPGVPDFSLIHSNNNARTPYPVFQIRFKNRSTIWKYYNKNSKVLRATEAAPLPMTFHGNAGTKQKPSEGFVKAEMNSGQITGLVSEIFI